MLLAMTAAGASADTAAPMTPPGALHGETAQELGAQASMRGRAAEPTAPWIADTWCGQTPPPLDDVEHRTQGSAPTFKVVYAHATDWPDGFATYAPVIQRAMRTAAGYVLQASGGRQSLRIDLGTSCGAQYVDIADVELPLTNQQYLLMPWQQRFNTISGQVKDIVGIKPLQNNVVIFADHTLGSDGVSGVGDIVSDDTPGPANLANQLGRSALLFGDGSPGFAPQAVNSLGHAILHEMSHTIGAVQLSAPHSTGAAHCYDGLDVMCYNDGGFAWRPMTVCQQLSYDCGGDDYYNPSPSPGSYLATHWNLASSSLVCQAASCGTATAAIAPTPHVIVTGPSSLPAPGPVTVQATDDSGAAVVAWRIATDGQDINAQPWQPAKTDTLTTTLSSPGARTITVQDSTSDGLIGTGRLAVQVASPAVQTAAPAKDDGGDIVLAVDDEAALPSRVTARVRQRLSTALSRGIPVHILMKKAKSARLRIEVVAKSRTVAGAATRSIRFAKGTTRLNLRLAPSLQRSIRKTRARTLRITLRTPSQLEIYDKLIVRLVP
jgi:hypothetical protein